jgi:nucleoside-specific outer membrane channel protein Tsx
MHGLFLPSQDAYTFKTNLTYPIVSCNIGYDDGFMDLKILQASTRDEQERVEYGVVEESKIHTSTAAEFAYPAPHAEGRGH